MDDAFDYTDKNGVKIQDNVKDKLAKSQSMLTRGPFWLIFLIIVLIIFCCMHKRKKEKKKPYGKQDPEEVDKESLQDRVPENFQEEKVALKEEETVEEKEVEVKEDFQDAKEDTVEKAEN